MCSSLNIKWIGGESPLETIVTKKVQMKSDFHGVELNHEIMTKQFATETRRKVHNFTFPTLAES